MFDRTILQTFLQEIISFTECLELLAVTVQQKPLIRMTGSANRLETLVALMRKLDLPHVIAPIHLVPRFDSNLDDHFASIAPGLPQDGQEGVLFAGLAEAVSAAMELELHGCPTMDAARLYGYPLCCAQNYDEHIQQGEYWINSFLSGLHGVVWAPWFMNRIGRLFSPCLSSLPDYFPCHLQCPASLELAKEYMTLLEKLDLALLVQLVKEHLTRPVLRHAGCLYLLQPSKEQELPAANTTMIAEIVDVISYAGAKIPENSLVLTYKNGALHIQTPGHVYTPESDTTLLLFK